MDEQDYFYVGTGLLSVPCWPEVVKIELEVGGHTFVAPLIFSTMEAAEEELREHRNAAADNYLRLVEKFGEEQVNEAYENSPELRVILVPGDLLALHLEDTDLPYLVVDGRVYPTRGFAEELRGD